MEDNHLRIKKTLCVALLLYPGNTFVPIKKTHCINLVINLDKPLSRESLPVFENLVV